MAAFHMKFPTSPKLLTPVVTCISFQVEQINKMHASANQVSNLGVLIAKVSNSRPQTLFASPFD